MTTNPKNAQGSDLIDDKQLEDIAAQVRMVSAADFMANKLTFARFGENPETGAKIPTVVFRINVNDIDAAARKIKHLSEQQHSNVYMSLAIMREDLPDGLKGSEADIDRVLGLCADFDDADASNYAARLPMAPDFVLQTSPGRYQCFFIFDQPLSAEEAKPLAQKLQKFANCDHGTADLSHVWRIAGTLNWPNKKKVGEGRAPQPCIVKVVKS